MALTEHRLAVTVAVGLQRVPAAQARRHPLEWAARPVDQPLEGVPFRACVGLTKQDLADDRLVLPGYSSPLYRTTPT